MKNIIWLILIIASGCSSSKSNKQSNDLRELDDMNFNITTPMTYSQRDDLIDRKSSDEFVAFANETFLDGNVEDAKNKELADIRKNCKNNSEGEMKEILIKFSDKYRKNPMFWNTIGNCYLINGNDLKAMLFYNKANDLSANYSPAINNLGVIYLRRNEEEKALVAFKRAYRENPKSNVVGYNLASLYVKYGLLERAREILIPIHQIHTQDRLIGTLLVATFRGMNEGENLRNVCSKMKKYFSDDSDLESNCKDQK